MQAFVVVVIVAATAAVVAVLIFRRGDSRHAKVEWLWGESYGGGCRQGPTVPSLLSANSPLIYIIL